MITKVFPAIKQKWPDRNRNIVIQQDGASAHIDENDPQFVAAATSGNWNISLMTQSPKLPDLNVLDLSFLGLAIKRMEQRACKDSGPAD
jgi:hypothetical protein